jgi:hypothetical protein
MKKPQLVVLTSLVLVAPFAFSAPLNDFSFKSPSFNGIGYSSHVLTIENQEHSRREQVRKEIQSAIDKAAAEAKSHKLKQVSKQLGITYLCTDKSELGHCYVC